MGIVYQSATNSVASVFNTVATTTTTIDKVVSSAYHGADALEANAKAYSRRTKITLAEQEDALLQQKRKAMAADRAAFDLQMEERFKSNPRLEELYNQHMSSIEKIQTKALDFK